jgi:hypothetical protein
MPTYFKQTQGVLIIWIHYSTIVVGGQSTQQFFTIKQIKHYCVNICFICVCYYNATCFGPLLGHLQAYSILALVTEINMNSYCVHNWF